MGIGGRRPLRLGAALVAVLSTLLVATPGRPSSATAAGVVTHHVRGRIVLPPSRSAAEVTVTLFDDEGDTVGLATVGPETDDRYDIEVVDGGPYLVTATVDEEVGGFRTQYYPDTYHVSQATLIGVDGADVSLQPMTMHLMHPVSGTVLAGGAPVSLMSVVAYPAGPGATAGDPGLGTVTDYTDGSYMLMLPSGSWKIRFSGISGNNLRPDRWAPAWYAAGSSYRDAAVVTVPTDRRLGTTVLTRGATIAGTLRDAATGIPVRKVDVFVINDDQRIAGTAVTRNDGTYRVGLLTAGSYTVRADDKNSHAFVTQYWPAAETSSDATPIAVLTDQTVGGIDLALTRTLPPDPSTVNLSGVVTDQDGVPQQGVAVTALPACWGPAEQVAHTGVDGRYAFTGLVGPAYRLHFTDTYGTTTPDVDDNYELVGGWSGGGTECEVASAVPVGTTDADEQLERAGGLSGSMTMEGGGGFVDGVVELVRTDGGDPGTAGRATPCEIARPCGTSYDFGGVPPGTYTVHFEDSSDYFISMYLGQSRTLAGAEKVTVLPGQLTPGADGQVWDKPFCDDRLTVTGTPQPGQALTTPGVTCQGHELTYTYTWVRYDERTDTNIQIGTGTSYVPTEADVIHQIEAHLVVTGPDGSSETRSDRLLVTRPKPIPPNTTPRWLAPPTIAGSPAVGSVLTASPGTWDPSTGISFSYHWYRGDQLVGSGPVYTVQPGDAGSDLRVLVVAQHGTGSAYGRSDTRHVPVGQVVHVHGLNQYGPRSTPGTVRIRVDIKAPPGVLVTPAPVLVREHGKSVAHATAQPGRTVLELGHVRPGRHTYVVTYTGTVGGEPQAPVIVRVRVPRPTGHRRHL